MGLRVRTADHDSDHVSAGFTAGDQPVIVTMPTELQIISSQKRLSQMGQEIIGEASLMQTGYLVYMRGRYRKDFKIVHSKP